MKPFYMWAGGKTKLLAQYAPLMPSRYVHYVEPFLGAGALAGMILDRGSFESPVPATLGDINRELMGVWHAVQNDLSAFCESLKWLESTWIESGDRKALYYELRQRYWDHPQPSLLYFLMRTGFNGVWQTCQASGGLFATPAGLCNQREGFIDHGLLRQWNRALQGVQLHTGGYQGIGVPDGSWVFCDPPYRDSFTSYGVAFGDDQQRELIAWCRDVANRGSTVSMSNRDAGDGFWETEAPEARIHRFPIVYTAGRRLRVEGGFEAKPATEVLLIWD